MSAGGGYAEFREDRSALLSTIRQTFTVPAGVQHLTFDLAAYGIEDPAGGVPDAFEAALLGPDNRPLVPAFRPGASAFVNLGPGHTVGLGSGASFDGTTVTLDLSGVAAGTAATLVFDLAGSPPGTTSVVGIDNVALDPSVAEEDMNQLERKTVLSSKVGVDATRKHKFPARSVPPKEDLDRVDAHWAEYGLE